MKRYEGLFILNNAGKEESLKEIIDKIQAEIVSVGGKVETVQKMDKKNFTRVADKKFTSGFYVNVLFEGKADAVAQLRAKFALNEEIFRTLFTIAPPPRAATIPAIPQ